MKKKNGIISFWRFPFALMIIILHCSVFTSNSDITLFKGGSIGVEFFFIVSGYLMALSVFKEKQENNLISDTWSFIFKKFKSVFPYALIGFILLCVFHIIFAPLSIYQWITSVFDLFFIRMNGLRSYRMNSVTWYISSMLIVMLILYPILKKYKKNYSCLIAPIIVIMLAGYMSFKYNNLRSPLEWGILTYRGNLRAFLEINIGIVAYEICEYLKRFNFTKLGRFTLTFIEISCFTSIFLIANFVDGSTRFDYIMIAIITVGVIIAFTGKTLTYKLSCNSFCYYLEKLSLPLYCNQRFFIYLIKNYSIFSGFNYYQKVAICLLMNIFFSVIILWLVEKYQEKKSIYLKKIKHLFVQ